MVFQHASQAETKTDKEKILQAFGLHNIQVLCLELELALLLKMFNHSILSGSFNFLTCMLPAAMTPFIRMT